MCVEYRRRHLVQDFTYYMHTHMTKLPAVHLRTLTYSRTKIVEYFTQSGQLHSFNTTAFLQFSRPRYRVEVRMHTYTHTYRYLYFLAGHHLRTLNFQQSLSCAFTHPEDYSHHDRPSFAIFDDGSHHSDCSTKKNPASYGN